MDGVEHQFYTMTWVVSPRAKYLGAFISSVEHQEKLVGTREVGTPRRVVASKKICWYSKKRTLWWSQEWSGSVLHAISPISEANWLVGGEVYKNVSTKQKMCVSPPAIFYSNLSPKP
jgi:hypothetical protein